MDKVKFSQTGHVLQNLSTWAET